jgi:hypothetical protein
MINELITKYKIFIDIQPIDSWDEWTFRIIGEDLMAPFCVMYQSNPETPYTSYQAALDAALNHIEKTILYE